VNKGVTPYDYSFDRILAEDTSQEMVYEHVKAAAEAVLTGINSTVFA
jgi:hypothetical protein